MAQNRLAGTELPAPVPGRLSDSAVLGPGDSSDSGSDMSGLEDELEASDQAVPVDVAMRDDEQRPSLPGELLDGAAADSQGTGERRSAGGDAGREAADISVDRVFTPGESDADEEDQDEDPDLAFIDRASGDEDREPEAQAVDDGARQQPSAPSRSVRRSGKPAIRH